MKRKIVSALAILSMLIPAIAMAMSYTGAFSADGDLSGQVRLKPGQRVSYSVAASDTAVGFIGTAVLEKSEDGNNWSTIRTFTGTLADALDDTPITGNFQNENMFKDMQIRLHLVNIDDENTSDSLDYSIASLASTYKKAKLEDGIIESSDGVTLMRFTDEGVEIEGISSGSGSLSPTSLTLPGSTSTTQTAEGEVIWDTNDNLLTVGTGAGRKTMVDLDSAQTITGAKTFTNVTLSLTSTEVIVTDCKIGATAGWAVRAATNLWLAGTLPASQSASTLVCPIPGIATNDQIVAFSLVGQIESAGNAVTLDADLRKVTAVAADVTDASISTMTQLSVTADTAVTHSNASKDLSSAYTAVHDETYYVKVTGTTLGSTDVALMAVKVTIIRSTSVIE